MQLKLTANSSDECVVAVAGEISHTSHDFAEPLRRLVGAFSARRILLDLESATTIDSSGVRWLLVCRQGIRASRGELILYSVPPSILTTLGLLNLSPQFVIAPNSKAARRTALLQEAS